LKPTRRIPANGVTTEAAKSEVNFAEKVAKASPRCIDLSGEDLTQS
jgi:hypothetical protein